MEIFAFDHIDLFVNDKEKTAEFYTNILGFQLYSYSTEEKKQALIFGNNKINLLSLDDVKKSNNPTPNNPTPGSFALCFVTNKPLKDIMNFLKERNIEIIDGPKRHTGATNLLISIYIRDPDGNVVQIANNVT
jgi:catechol-2,3-dioxygenase